MHRLTLFTIFVSFSLLLSSCDDEDKEQVGVVAKTATTNFEIITGFQLSNTNPNFAGTEKDPGDAPDEDTVFITAEFNEEVTATVQFQGQQSGAQRTLVMTTKRINAGDLFWIGEHEGWDFFRANEKVNVSFKIAGYTKAIPSQSLTIQCPNDYRGGRNNALYDWSFEDNCELATVNFFGSYPTTDPNRPAIVPFSTPNGVNAARFVSFKNKSGFRNGSTFSEGSSVSVLSQFIFFNGYLEDPDEGDFGLRNIENMNQTTNPDSVWFNVFLYGNGTPSTRAIIVLGETDCPAGLETDCNDFTKVESTSRAFWRAHNRLIDDRLIIEAPMTHTGWKLFSYRYSDIPFAGNVAFGGNGNKIYEPHRLNLIDFSLESELPGFAEYYVDFPIITYGGPFDPTKF